MGLEELRPEETQLLALMQEYKQTSNEMRNATHLIDIELENIQEHHDDVAKPYQDKLNDLATKIRLPMLDYQHTFKSSFGTVSYRKGAVRITWNLDALDQICTAKPEVKNEIWAFRTESIGEPSISIKVE